jgi:hypothetical protein
VGITLGVAVFGAVAGSVQGAAIGPGFAQATRPGWWIVAALGLAVAALGYLTTTGWARDTARRTAQRLEERRAALIGPAVEGRVDRQGSGTLQCVTCASPPSTTSTATFPRWRPS